MIKEAYVSYEVAKLLKEKGFDEPCRSYFISDSDEYRKCAVDITSKNCISGQILRPSHQMACAWLREEKDIYIEIRMSFNTYCFKYLIYKDATLKATCSPDNLTYEEAVEAALKYTLENLI